MHNSTGCYTKALVKVIPRESFLTDNSDTSNGNMYEISVSYLYIYALVFCMVTPCRNVTPSGNTRVTMALSGAQCCILILVFLH